MSNKSFSLVKPTSDGAGSRRKKTDGGMGVNILRFNSKIGKGIGTLGFIYLKFLVFVCVCERECVCAHVRVLRNSCQTFTIKNYFTSQVFLINV